MNIESLYNKYLNSTGVNTDTRTLNPGNIYFALKGPSFNGNKFASKAIEQGASLVVLDEDNEDIDPKKKYLCENVLKALQHLSNFHRKKLSNTHFIGITGTNGKTTTKELIYAVLSKYYPTQATKGNLNNHIGVPLTLLSIKPETKYAIIEMGASAIGEIDFLSSLSSPDSGIITNVGKAHLEGFGSPENVLIAKTELYKHLRNKIIFVHAEYEYLLNALPQECTTVKYQNCTSPTENNCLKINNSYPTLTLETIEGEIIRTKLFGNYNLANISAAYTIAKYFKVPEKLIIEALEEYTPSNNRSQVDVTKRNTLIVDAYNANVSSMAEALKSFSTLEAPNKVIILGEMLELGDVSEQEHQNLLNLCKNLHLTGYVIGPSYRKLQVPKGIEFIPSSEELLNLKTLQKMENNTILLKGSRGSKLEELIPYL